MKPTTIKSVLISLGRCLQELKSDIEKVCLHNMYYSRDKHMEVLSELARKLERIDVPKKSLSESHRALGRKKERRELQIKGQLLEEQRSSLRDIKEKKLEFMHKIAVDRNKLIQTLHAQYPDGANSKTSLLWLLTMEDAIFTLIINELPKSEPFLGIAIGDLIPPDKENDSTMLTLLKQYTSTLENSPDIF